MAFFVHFRNLTMLPLHPSRISMRCFFFVALLPVLLFPFTAFSQTFDFISYSVEEGLSQSEVQSVFQDSRGYLWVGTTGGGVCHFDGKGFTEYGTHEGLAGQIVNCTNEDANGNIWVGTQTGLSFFDGKLFTNFDRTELRKDKITSLIPGKNAMWIGGPGGIFEYTLSDKQLHLISTMQFDVFMCRDENNILWAGSANKLYRFTDSKKDSVNLNLPKDAQILSVTTDMHGLLYIGTSHGLIIYRPSTGTLTENELTKSLSGKTVHDVFVDHTGAIWIATTNNLVLKYLSGGQISRYDKSNGLSAEAVFRIIEDNTHHIWFATREQSLLKLRSETFTYFGNVTGFNSGTVFRIMEDHAGRIWTGSNEDGLYYYDYKKQDGKSVAVLNGNKVFVKPVAAIEDNMNRIWVGHEDGITCLVNERPVKQLLSGTRVRSLLCDSKGNIWIGTWGKGVYIYDGQTIHSFETEKQKLPSDYVHTFCEDQKGNIWIGTGNGLAKFDGANLTLYGIDAGLCNTYIGALTEDKAGNIWFYTDACLMRYDGQKFTSYTDANGLASNTFYLLTFDLAGNLWVGTNKGIDRMQVDADGRVLSVKNFSRNEGFRGIECNSRADCLSSDGCLWFGTVKGVIRYDPSKEITDNIQPSVHINDIRLFLEPTDWTQMGVKENGWFHLPEKLVLNYDRNHLTFQYEAIHLQSPLSTRYKFMLAGFDSTWQPVTSATEITYANLPPGDYTFRVIASNRDAKWTALPELSCPITILPPPPPVWLRSWFIISAILVIGGLLWYIIRIRTRRSVEQRALLEAQVRERTLEISRQNEEKTVMLKEIHHRVKNNLQVISSLLNLQAEGIEDRHVLALFEDCRHRVNSMALIHEKMYQSKTLVNIDIGNYIDELIGSLIDAYDSNKTIHLHTDIENHLFRIDTIVPMGLILNEIVSNALKYAFEDRTEGNLKVQLKKTGTNEFSLDVSDDGNGIPEKINFETADSLGMQLIQMLSGQISGKVQLFRENGTRYHIDFKEEAKDRF